MGQIESGSYRHPWCVQYGSAASAGLAKVANIVSVSAADSAAGTAIRKNFVVVIMIQPSKECAERRR